MADTSLLNKYFIKRKSSDSWQDISTAFTGLRVLKVDGIDELGDAVNVYDEQWVDKQAEDFMVTTQVNNADVIIRKNVDITVTFAISRRYVESSIDEQTVYNSLQNYVNGGDFYFKTNFTSKEAHVICLKGMKPTTLDLQRGDRSYVIGTITLHTLDIPA